MCAITGFFQTKFDYTKDLIWKNRLNKMANSLSHRGPDNTSFLLKNHVGLAHCRLSIIDLESGNQPIIKCINGHTGAIIFNGEIYNYKTLRAYLSSLGCFFDTASDTEVILAGYLMFGTSFFSSLNGIFAFAIYDYEKDCLILARDSAGVKPLFYQDMSTSFVFASEPKGLFAYGIKAVFNDNSFQELFALGPAKTPGNAVFAGMHEVLPGTYITVSKGQYAYTFSTHIFRQLSAYECNDSYDEAIEKSLNLVTDAITSQMVSDVPICTFLSGGLDSSLVSAICAKNLDSLTTYSFDFVGNNDNFIANDFQSSLDRPFVDIMKEHIKSNHIYLECDNLTMADYLTKAVDAKDMMCMADVESSLLYFCEQVSSKHKVCLTGECADEIFGGYPWFNKPFLMDKNDFPWSYDFDARFIFLKDEIINDLHLKEYAHDAFVTTINNAPVLSSDSPMNKKYKQMTYLNITWFMQTLLSRMDRTSMYNSLEARVPFADMRIIEYIYNLPYEYKCMNKYGAPLVKNILIECGKSYLPDEILYRKKSPYPKTYDKKYEELLANKLRDILSNTTSPLHQFVDMKKVNSFLNSPKDYGKPWYGQLMAGPQMIAYFIQLNYLITSFD